jgi:RNA polymerase sigma-54 factor
MALGPRLDLRQSQSLVMTPQLRQAIKLLQSSNMEVTAFVEEELERNPLLERDERAEPRTVADERAPEAAAPEPADSHAAASSDSLPAESAAPLDAEWDNVYDPDSGFRSGAGAGGRASFDEELGTIEDFADVRISLREHLAEQIRLTFSDARDRLIAAQMLAMVDAAGRLTVADAAIAAAMGAEEAQVAGVRARLQRLDPAGMFCRDLRECLAVQLADRNRLDPCMEALLDNLDMLARRDLRGPDARLRRGSRDLADMIAELKRLDPKPGASYDASRAADGRPTC